MVRQLFVKLGVAGAVVPAHAPVAPIATVRERLEAAERREQAFSAREQELVAQIQAYRQREQDLQERITGQAAEGVPP